MLPFIVNSAFYLHIAIFLAIAVHIWPIKLRLVAITSVSPYHTRFNFRGVFRSHHIFALLDWKEFDDRTSTALLQWIYTDKVVLSYISDSTDPEQWLDLLHGSYKLQLFPLFTICEQTLLSLIDSYPSQRFYDIAKTCGADQLLEKFSQLRLKAPPISSVKYQNSICEFGTDYICVLLIRCNRKTGSIKTQIEISRFTATTTVLRRGCHWYVL